jgi:hypothetical protein
MKTKVDRVRPNFKDRRGVILAELGEWDWSDGEEIIFTSDKLGFVSFRAPQGFGGAVLTLLHAEGFSYAIGIYDGGHTVWRFQSTDGRIEAVASLTGRDRVEDGFQFVKGFANGRGMLVVYETGLLFFDPVGSLRWRQDDLKLDFKFMELLDSGVLYQDAKGRQWVYSLVDGSRTEA